VLESEFDYTFVLQSEYALCLHPSTHCAWIWVCAWPYTTTHCYIHLVGRVWLDLVLQSEYNFCLSTSRPLLSQSEYTFCLNLSRPYFWERERIFFVVLPLPSLKKVCGKLLIRSILFGHAIQFWSSPEKISKSCSKKIEKNKQQQKRGFVCVFFVSVVVLCDYLCVQTRISSTI
jgi:hypothetical protein